MKKQLLALGMLCAAPAVQAETLTVVTTGLKNGNCQQQGIVSSRGIRGSNDHQGGGICCDMAKILVPKREKKLVIIVIIR